MRKPCENSNASFDQDEEIQTLRARLEAVEAAHALCKRHRLELAARNRELTSVVSAGQRLHAAKTRRAVVEAIEQIVIGSVRCEQFAIFEAQGAALHLVSSHGVQASALRAAPIARGVFGAIAGRGRPWFAASDEGLQRLGDYTVLAAVPLTFGSCVVGLVALFELPPGEEEFARLDREILELVGHIGGLAWHCASLESVRPTVRPPKRGPS